MKKQSVKIMKHKKNKKMNKTKSKKGKKRTYRKQNDRARGITSSKPKNPNMFQKLYELENEQNIMTILEKMVAIKQIDPENTVVTISSVSALDKISSVPPTRSGTESIERKIMPITRPHWCWCTIKMKLLLIEIRPEKE